VHRLFKANNLGKMAARTAAGRGRGARSVPKLITVKAVGPAANPSQAGQGRRRRTGGRGQGA